ncbi:EAL domain, c-di-GMP-specific phosphodiesterase class I (or its enzymatically inactive variant) [Granulicatella balaenopterae]|uniref:EAL domain, c-di-GMP-specific phosphodiesterase class I (Or its enzymatically inactive variant) n=1 Tax=Granulicatella balaenopterae TaxID=137733 RepID=A0A1H9ISY3_9LACT|nr:EAL domain-containing protein [Granulicatella balaenopterae]SEQ77515.1 EAL domain, c-di-GMP-specific phosphodiesterase class I (or its enzymatically inactive variant) [Granulicatella balaenopterae]
MFEYLLQDSVILISIILTELAFLRYYHAQNPLPLKRNEIVSRLFRAIVLLSIVDFVVTVFVQDRMFKEQIGLLYGLISVYYLMYQHLFTHILEYILAKCHKYKYLEMLQKKSYLLLVFVAIVLMMNYYFGNMFYLVSTGVYIDGRYYMLLQAIPIMILVYSMVISFKERHLGVFYAMLVLAVGTIMQHFTNTIALEICIVFSVNLLYVTTESPFFFESENIKGVYNTKGFIALINQYKQTKQDFYVYGISIQNFDSLKKRYGSTDFYIGLQSFSQWLKEVNQEGYLFYTNNQCFNIITTTALDTEDLAQDIYERTKKSFKIHQNEMYIWAKFLTVKTNSAYCLNGSDIINAEQFALDIYAEKDFQLAVGDKIFAQLNYNTQVEEAIQRSIDQHNIEIYIQPIYNPSTKKIEGGEILTRINDEQLGLIMPNDFISLAEKNGSIFELSLLIFEETCHYLSQNDLESQGIKFINVNCSPVQFQNINLVTELKGISDKYGVFFSIFDFEVTESNMNSENLLKNHIAKMKEYHATASLDDFGTGGSDIFRLTSYDFTLAKLDKSLVWKYFDRKTNILVDIISMFKNENLQIVAEGVETKEMADELAILGCDYLQGYFFSKPLPAEEFLDFVKNYHQKQE